MNKHEIDVNPDLAVQEDTIYKKEIFRQNFSIEALLYMKYSELSRLHCFQNEQEYFSRQVAEATRKLDAAGDNIETTKNEIQAIESVIAEKRQKIKQNKIA
jgi:hypothetical protein